MDKNKPISILLLVVLLGAVIPAFPFAHATGLPSTITTSSNAQASAYTSEQKLVRASNGTLFAVYDREAVFGSGYDQVYVSKSIDNGTTWIDETMVSTYSALPPSDYGGEAIAIDSLGHLHVAYLGNDGSNPYLRIYYVEYTTSWSAQLMISTAPPSQSVLPQEPPSIAIDSSNNVYVAWDGLWTTTPPIVYQIWVAVRSSGVWATPVDISTATGMDGYDQRSPSVAIDSNNYVHVVWFGRTSGFVPQIFYAEYTTSWQPPVLISTYAGMSTSGQASPVIAVDSNDNLYVTWFGGTNVFAWRQIWCGEYNATASTWNTPNRVSTYAGMDTNHQENPTIAIDSANTVRILWDGMATGYLDYNKVWLSKYVSPSWSAPTVQQPTGQNVFPNLRWSEYPTSNKVITSLDYVFTEGTASPYSIMFDSMTVPPIIIVATTHTGGGTISPSGSVIISPPGINKAFTITASAGSHITGVFVDNVSVGAVPFYTFLNVVANHTITVNFDSGKITNPDDGTNVYAEKKFYDLQAIAGLVPGSTITAMSVKLKNGATTVYMNGSALDTSPVWTSDSGVWDCNSGTWDGATDTAVFYFVPHWDAVPGTYTISVSALDTWGHNTTWVTESNFVDVNRLVLSGLGSNVTTVVPGNFLRVNGTVRYALTPTGNNPSASYPTNVITAQIRDQFNVSYGSALITDGAFKTTFPVTGFSQTNKLYVWMSSPYNGFKDGLTPEGKYLTITLLSSNSTNIIANAFSLFGMSNFLSNIVTTLTSFGHWFAQSLTYFANLLIQIVTFLMYTGGVALWWVTNFFDIIIKIIGYINSLLLGLIGLAGTTINWFAIFFTPQNMYFALIMLFILWFDALSIRAHNQGITWLQVLIADTQTAIYVVGFMINTALSLVNFVLDVIMRFISIL